MIQRGTLTCALVAAGVFAGLLTAWRSVSASMTPAPQHPSQLESRTRWIKPGHVPLMELGDLDAARTVLIGDSRIMNGARREMLDDAGLGPSCVLWRGGADLIDLLGAIDPTRVERLVVALSPLSISPFENKIMQEVVRERAPVFEPGEHSPTAILEWTRAETLHLLKKDYPRPVIDVLLTKLRRTYDKESAALTRTGGIDHALSRSLKNFRADACKTVRPGQWDRSWLHLQRDEKSNTVYRSQLSTKRYRKSFKGKADTIVTQLAELSRELDLVVVRVPVSPALREVEDDALPPRRLAQIASRAKVPYFDFGTSPHTGDGSHLDSVGSVEWTRLLIKKLEEHYQSVGR